MGVDPVHVAYAVRTGLITEEEAERYLDTPTITDGLDGADTSAIADSSPWPAPTPVNIAEGVCRRPTIEIEL